MILYLIVFGFKYVFANKKVLILEALLQVIVIVADYKFFIFVGDPFVNYG